MSKIKKENTNSKKHSSSKSGSVYQKIHTPPGGLSHNDNNSMSTLKSLPKNHSKEGKNTDMELKSDQSNKNNTASFRIQDLSESKKTKKKLLNTIPNQQNTSLELEKEKNNHHINFVSLAEKVTLDENNVREKYMDKETEKTINKYLILSSDMIERNTKKCNKCNKEYDEKTITKIISECGHELCSSCYKNLKSQLCEHFKTTEQICHNGENIYHKVCPQCSLRFKIVKVSEKYVVFCLGQKTDKYKFDNGGYLNIHLCLFPDNTTETYSYIAYYRHNKVKNRIIELFKNGYVFIIQDSKTVMKWMDEVRLDAFKNNNNIVYTYKN